MKSEWKIYLRFDEYRIGRERLWGIQWYKEKYRARHIDIFKTDSPVVARSELSKICEEEEKKVERKKRTWVVLKDWN